MALDGSRAGGIVALNTQPPGPARDAGMAMLAQHTAPTDPAAATAWAAAMTPGPRRDAALQQALSAWMRADDTAASTWMAGQCEQRRDRRIKRAV